MSKPAGTAGKACPANRLQALVPHPSSEIPVESTHLAGLPSSGSCAARFDRHTAQTRLPDKLRSALFTKTVGKGVVLLADRMLQRLPPAVFIPDLSTLRANGYKKSAHSDSRGNVYTVCSIAFSAARVVLEEPAGS